MNIRALMHKDGVYVHLNDLIQELDAIIEDLANSTQTHPAFARVFKTYRDTLVEDLATIKPRR